MWNSRVGIRGTCPALRTGEPKPPLWANSALHKTSPTHSCLAHNTHMLPYPLPFVVVFPPSYNGKASPLSKRPQWEIGSVVEQQTESKLATLCCYLLLNSANDSERQVTDKRHKQTMIIVDKATFSLIQTASRGSSVAEAPVALKHSVSRCQYKAPLSLSIVSSSICSLWLVSNLLSYGAVAYFFTGIWPMTSVCWKEAKVCPAMGLVKSRWNSLKMRLFKMSDLPLSSSLSSGHKPHMKNISNLFWCDLSE